MRSLLTDLWKQRHVLGITRVADNTALDTIGIPVVIAIRPAVSVKQITTCQGKGINFEEAMIGALCESVERYCASKIIIERTSSVNSLRLSGCNVISPEMLGITNITDGDLLDWVTVNNLQSKSIYWIPAGEVIFPYYASCNDVKTFRSSTSGLAAGADFDDAVLRSIFEVVERNAVSLYYENLNCPYINQDNIKNVEINYILGKFTTNDIQVIIIDLGRFSPFPTYLVHSIDHRRKEPFLYTSGQACHLNSVIALKKALLEVVQARIVAIQSSREDFHDIKEIWQLQYKDVLNRFNYFLINSIETGVIEDRFDSFNDNQVTLSQVISHLEVHGYGHVFFKNISDDRLPVKATHVTILGMVDSFIDKNRKRLEPNEIE